MKPFETDRLFTGGSGFFIEYHDIIKPVYLFAVCKMILMKEKPFGLPFHILSHLSHHSIVEWYMNRNKQNPMYNIDYHHHASMDDLNRILQNILQHDRSLYRLAPSLNVVRMLSVYQQQHMTFPVYVYLREEEIGAEEDLKDLLPSVPLTFVHGNINDAIRKLPDNFTYIFSSMELLESAIAVLNQKFCHVLLAVDYSYNYSDFNRTFIYPVEKFQNDHIRFGLIHAVNRDQLAASVARLIK